MTVFVKYKDLEDHVRTVIKSRSDLLEIEDDIIWGIEALFSPKFPTPRDVRILSSPQDVFKRTPLEDPSDSSRQTMYLFDGIVLPVYDSCANPSSYNFQLVTSIISKQEHNLFISVQLTLGENDYVLAEYTQHRLE
jgi:hypothetical protein